MALSSTQVVFRGTTVGFFTNFFDVNNNLVQPDSATINFVYATTQAPNQSAEVPMTPPSGPETRWTALWDTRGLAAPQIVYWSIHTGTADPIPVAVEDGSFQLAANAANLPTF